MSSRYYQPPRNLLPVLLAIFGIILASCTASLPPEIVDDSGAPMVLVPAGEYEITIRDHISGDSVVKDILQNELPIRCNGAAFDRQPCAVDNYLAVGFQV